MRSSTSLRVRLMVLIVAPLLAVAAVASAWQVAYARQKAFTLFDRSLLTVALAVAADVARSGGDALSLETRDLLSDTSGGPVYYHAYAPSGVYVTGYATPPCVRPMPSPSTATRFTASTTPPTSAAPSARCACAT